MNSDQLAKVKSLLIKKGYKESSITKNWFFTEDGSDRAADLRKANPIIGILISGNIVMTGHGNLKVEDDITEVEAIMKSKQSQSQGIESSKGDTFQKTKMQTYKKLEVRDNLQSSVPDSSESAKTDKINSDQQKPCEAVPAGTLLDAKASKAETTEPNSKLGAGDNTMSNNPVRPENTAGFGESGSTPLADTSIKKGTTKATCPDCKTIFETTMDEAKALYDKYDGVYCQKCRDKPAEGKQNETEHKKEEITKNAKAEEYKARPEEPKVKEKVMDEKLPANKQEAKLPVKKTDAQIDEMIELAKAEKFLKGQGGSYSVSGKNRPDSAMVQKIANTADISCEILIAEQTKEYAHVVVRGHRNNKYVDAVVHHDFETEFQLQTMEIIKKNPHILDHYEGLIPVLKEGANIVLSDKQVDAKYHLIHTLLSFKTFSLRDATTKAMQIVQSKLLNEDPRTQEEVASEQKERDLVEEKRNRK